MARVLLALLLLTLPASAAGMLELSGWTWTVEEPGVIRVRGEVANVSNGFSHDEVRVRFEARGPDGRVVAEKEHWLGHFCLASRRPFDFRVAASGEVATVSLRVLSQGQR